MKITEEEKRMLLNDVVSHLLAYEREIKRCRRKKLTDKIPALQKELDLRLAFVSRLGVASLIKESIEDARDKMERQKINRAVKGFKDYVRNNKKEFE